MARHSSALVSPGFYRHVAVATVAVTFCVALFAEAPRPPSNPESTSVSPAPAHPAGGRRTIAGLVDNRTSWGPEVIESEPVAVDSVAPDDIDSAAGLEADEPPRPLAQEPSLGLATARSPVPPPGLPQNPF